MRKTVLLLVTMVTMILLACGLASAQTSDTTPPDTTITSGPQDGGYHNGSPTYEFASSEANSTFECRVLELSELWEPCDSGGPRLPSITRDGLYTFEVRAIDAAGNLDPTPARRSVTIDTVQPHARLDSGPSGTVYTNSVTFHFSADEPNAQFRCHLLHPDGTVANESPCLSPKTYSVLPDGTYEFGVAAFDRAGNFECCPVAREFTINTNPPPDDAAPDTSIAFGPEDGSITNSPGVRFSFASDKADSTFECRVLDLYPSWESCSSPKDYAFADGTHTFEVRAIDSAGRVDPTPAQRTVTIDTVYPTAVIDSGPSGTINTDIATFEFSAGEPTLWFGCHLIYPDTTFIIQEPCSSPKRYSNLPNGTYEFGVWAVDEAQNRQAIPTTRTFTVDATSTPPPMPVTKQECKNGGYKDFGFKNNGQCVKAVKKAP